MRTMTRSRLLHLNSYRSPARPSPQSTARTRLTLGGQLPWRIIPRPSCRPRWSLRPIFPFQPSFVATPPPPGASSRRTSSPLLPPTKEEPQQLHPDFLDGRFPTRLAGRARSWITQRPRPPSPRPRLPVLQDAFYLPLLADLTSSAPYPRHLQVHRPHLLQSVHSLLLPCAHPKCRRSPPPLARRSIQPPVQLPVGQATRPKRASSPPPPDRLLVHCPRHPPHPRRSRPFNARRPPSRTA